MSEAQAVLARRRSGVLLPASALREEHRGAFGDPARRFIDWLAECGFHGVAAAAARAHRQQWLALLGACGSRRQQ